MIKVEVEEYCQQCLDFEPDVTKPERVQLPGGETSFGDTTIRCEYRKRCAAIERYLKRQSEVEVAG